MNLAKLHDGAHVATFWEKKIHNDSQHAEREEQRRSQSALKKLRAEWRIRLENRTKHLKKLQGVKKVEEESADPSSVP